MTSVVVLSGWIATGHAQDSTYIVWDPQRQISFDPYFSGAAQIAAVGDTVHLMWTTISGPITNYSRTTDGGTTWSPQITLDDSNAITATTAFYFCAARSYVYLFFNTCPPPCSTIAGYLIVDLRRSLDAGSTWLPTVTIASDSTIHNYAEYASARDSAVAFVNPRSGLFAKLRFGWSSDVGADWNYSKYDPNVWGFDRFVILSNGIHLTKEIVRYSIPEVAYLYNSDFGATWTAPYYLSSFDSIGSDEQQIAGDDGGHVYIVWRDGKYGSVGGYGATILLRRSTDLGLTWQAEQRLSSRPVDLVPRVASERNNVGVAWDDDSSGNIVFRLSTDYGNSFLPAQILAQGGDVALAITNSRIHVTWAQSDGEIYYRRGTIVVTSVDGNPSLPKVFTLHQNYPNPFNSETIISYELPEPSQVILSVYDVLGREVQSLVSETQQAGAHQVRYSASRLSSGVYFYRLQTAKFSGVKKFIVVR